MRTYQQSKVMARSLRESLSARNIELSHAECLEIVARQFGFAEWNILAAKLRVESATDRPGGDPVSLEPPIPVIRVDSMIAAKEFYVDFLGFEFDWGADPIAGSTYAQVSRDGVQLHLAVESQGGRPCALLFRDLTGLDALHAELRQRSGKFELAKIQFTPWDSREFQVRDPSGNLLRFWENNPPGVAR